MPKPIRHLIDRNYRSVYEFHSNRTQLCTWGRREGDHLVPVGQAQLQVTSDRGAW